MNLQVAALSLLTLLIPVRATADEITPKAKERAAALKADLPGFVLSLRYHGPQDKPYFGVILTTAEVRDGAPFLLRAKVTEAQATALIDFLARDGVLDAADGPDANRAAPKDAQAYVLTVAGGNRKWVHVLDFNPAMLARLDALHALLDGEPKRVIGVLIDRLAGHRREWEKK